MFLFSNGLFWYKLIFMAELISAEILFMIRLKRKNKFALRVVAMILLSLIIAFLFPIIAYDPLYLSFMFLMFFAITMICSKFCYNEHWLNILFCGLAAYSVQHISYQVYSMIISLTGLENGLPIGVYEEGSSFLENGFDLSMGLTLIVYLDAYGIIYWILYLIFGDRINKKEDLRVSNTRLLFLSGIMLIIDIILNAFVVYSDFESLSKQYRVIINIYNIVCCILALSLQFNILSQKKLKSELDTVNNLWRKEKEHYEISKENINLINLKCHDLKHQIRKFGRKGELEESTIKEMEKAISIYDSTVKTGNEALDVILTEKSLYCTSKDIKLSCIIDGSKLNFMKESDIYSLFGNAVDNAIEALKQVDDIEKRVVTIIVKSSGSMVSININNYFDGKLTFENGLPITTKKDKGFHGFGIKSIRYIVEKYDGDFSLSVKDNMFNINILFFQD